MASLIRSAPGGAPFPPVLLARGLATLAAQTYASSHPLSALQLLDPPLSTSAAQSSHPALLTGAPLAEYDFEPRFPVRVVWSAEEMERQRKEGIPWYEAHRIEHLLEEEAEESLDRVELRDAEKDGPEEMRRWLEEVVGL